MFLFRNRCMALENKQPAPLSYEGTIGTLGSLWGDGKEHGSNVL